MIEARSGAGTKIGSSDEVNLTQALSAEAIGYIKASDPGEWDYFGQAVAISGDGSTMAVGAALQEDDGSNNGAVYIFKQNEGVWAFTIKVTPNTRLDNDNFGRSVPLSHDGTTLAVGAPLGNDQVGGIGTGNSTNDLALDAGAVYVYTLAADGTSRSNQVYIKASDPDAFDQFGYTLALADIDTNGGGGQILAVGAPYEDGSGAVYVFERDNGTWTQDAKIKASNAGLGDNFGKSVAITEGATKRFLAVGALAEDSAGTDVNGGQELDNSLPESGAVYVYEDDGSGWPAQENYYIKANDSANSDWFGYSVALSNSGERLAVGALRGGDSVVDSGAVYVFDLTDFGYAQSIELTAQNAGMDDRFGASVSLSGDGAMLAVGATGEGSSSTGINGDGADDPAGQLSGAAYVFTRSGSVWSQSYVKASNTSWYSFFGRSVSLSDDGSVLAVGAPEETSAATGVDGTVDAGNSVFYSGAVYLY